MELNRMTILPTDRKADARAIFNQLIDDEPLVLFVVLHRDEDSKTLTHRAAKGAGTKGPAWVVWARSPEHIADRISSLKGAEQIRNDLNQIRAFTLSFSESRASRSISSVTSMSRPSASNTGRTPIAVGSSRP